MENREQEALGAYLKLLRNKGANDAVLQRRETFLTGLVEVLTGKPNDGSVYRQAVEQLLDQSDKRDWSFCLTTAREYFPFWANDIKAIAALNAEAGFDIGSMQWQPAECNLKTLWTVLDRRNSTSPKPGQ